MEHTAFHSLSLPSMPVFGRYHGCCSTFSIGLDVANIVLLSYFVPHLPDFLLHKLLAYNLYASLAYCYYHGPCDPEMLYNKCIPVLPVTPDKEG